MFKDGVIEIDNTHFSKYCSCLIVVGHTEASLGADHTI